MIRVSSFLFGTIRTHHVEVCCGIQRNQQDKEKLACRSRKCVYSIWRASFTKIGFPQNTISQHYYRQVIERLRRRRFLGVRPNTADNWGLHRDNAHPMLWGKFFFLPTLIFAFCVWAYKRYSNAAATFSPSSPCDFLLFPSVKSIVEGHHFETTEYIS